MIHSQLTPAILGCTLRPLISRTMPFSTWRLFSQADAEALPFEDESFHLYTIAFGLRNVTDVSDWLAIFCCRGEAMRGSTWPPRGLTCAVVVAADFDRMFLPAGCCLFCVVGCLCQVLGTMISTHDLPIIYIGTDRITGTARLNVYPVLGSTPQSGRRNFKASSGAPPWGGLSSTSRYRYDIDFEQPLPSIPELLDFSPHLK